MIRFIGKVILCAILSALIALIITPLPWEATARREWKEYAAAAKDDAATREEQK